MLRVLFKSQTPLCFACVFRVVLYACWAPIGQMKSYRGNRDGSRIRRQLAAALLLSLSCQTGEGFAPNCLPPAPRGLCASFSSRAQPLFPTGRPCYAAASVSSQKLPKQGKSFFSRALQRASTHFSSFFGETNSSSIPLAYELRMLELEERVLKLEGMLAKSSAKFARGGATTNGKGDVKGGAGGVPPAYEPMMTIPVGEQLLLACTFAGALVGLLAGKALLRQQMYLAVVGGAMSGVWLYNKEGNYGECIRAMGKLVLYACGRLNYAWQELKFNWKAWRVYERSFKKLEVLDREMQISDRLKKFDREYQVSNNMNMWWRKAQGMVKSVEDNVRDQITHFQRTQRLRDEQQQAWLIQQEIARQQAAQQAQQQQAANGGVGMGGMGGPGAVAGGPYGPPPTGPPARASRFETGSMGGRASTDLHRGAPTGGGGGAEGGATAARWGHEPRRRGHSASSSPDGSYAATAAASNFASLTSPSTIITSFAAPDPSSAGPAAAAAAAAAAHLYPLPSPEEVRRTGDRNAVHWIADNLAHVGRDLQGLFDAWTYGGNSSSSSAAASSGGAAGVGDGAVGAVAGQPAERQDKGQASTVEDARAGGDGSVAAAVVEVEGDDEEEATVLPL